MVGRWRESFRSWQARDSRDFRELGPGSRKERREEQRERTPLVSVSLSASYLGGTKSPGRKRKLLHRKLTSTEER